MASSASTVMPPSRWLPIWSILEMDLKQTVKGWLYRLSLLAVLIISIGVLLNRAAIHREAGLVQYASNHVGDFLQYAVIFGAALSALFTANVIAGERGNLIDSTLCRGVGRWHFYVGKWVARTVAVLGGFLVVGLIFMVAAVFILKSDLDFDRCLVALILVGSVLWLMVSITMAVSATVNNTMLSLGLVLLILYGVMAVLWLVPLGNFTLNRFLIALPNMIRATDGSAPPGTYYLPMMPYLKLAGYIALVSCITAVVGMVHFMRKDV